MGPAVELVEADAMDPATLEEALRGVDVAYYLVHAIDTGDIRGDRPQIGGQLRPGAERAGVRRIVYLGGLAPATSELSPHLRSRAEVGRVLLTLGCPTVAARGGHHRFGIAPPSRCCAT